MHGAIDGFDERTIPSVKMRGVCLLLFVSGLPFQGLPGRTGVGSSLAPLGEHHTDQALESRLHSIESAFRDGKASALAGSFSKDGKVRVEISDLPQGEGSYAAGQLQVIFDRIFEEFRTREFAFTRDDVRISRDGTAFARSRWVRRRPRGDETVDTLTFTLRDESGDWRILEIRASR
jgi:hypothetical protein